MYGIIEQMQEPDMWNAEGVRPDRTGRRWLELSGTQIPAYEML